MNFLRFIEYITLILIAIGVVTQVLIPALRGTQSFPLFRRGADLTDQLRAVRQQKLEKSLEDQVNEEKKNL